MFESDSAPHPDIPGRFKRPWHSLVVLVIYLSLPLPAITACGKDSPTGAASAIPYKITVTPESLHTTIDQTVSLTASVQNQYGEVISDAVVSWRSRDESVVKVNAEGQVHTIGHGTALITATSGQVQGNASVTVSNPDRVALMALYEATDGKNWTNSTNWSSDEPVGGWYGVYDDFYSQSLGRQSGSNSGLERLDLSNNQLSGDIPHILGSLSSLRYLDLSQNALTGEIPAALGNLTKLDTLRLHDNQLSGEIPTELGNLSSLRELSLHDNAELTGPLPLSFTNLDTLATLSLSGTLLCAPTDSTFQNWLEGIENKSGVVNCGDDAVLDRNVLITFFNATDGTNWKTSTNWLTDEALETWYGVGVNADGRVDSLSLEENGLSGALTGALGNLADLRVLDISDNQLYGNIPTEMGNLSNLVTLDLSDNELSGEVPFTVISLPSLQYLDLSGNQFADLPSERDALVKFYNATGGPNWNTSTNWLSEQPIGSWYGVTTNESESAVTGLVLSFNNLTGKLPPALGQLASLTSLDLEYNDLSGGLPTELGSLTGLTNLDLSDNEFTGEIPPDLGQLTNLNSLDLSWNDLSGQLPTEMTQLVNLARLYLNATSVCVPRTEDFQAWINGVGFSRISYCIGGTAGNAPIDQTAFDAVFTDHIFSVESYYVEFNSGGRFTENGEYEGTYSYDVGDSSASKGILTLKYDTGVVIDSCTVELLFVEPTKGNTRYRCDEGLLQEFEQWRLSDSPDPDNFDIEIIWVGDEPGGSYQMAFESAVERWESIITGDLTDEYLYWPDLPYDADEIDDLFENGSQERIFGYVDDLRLYVQMASIDGEEGLLGVAATFFQRSSSNLPTMSGMILDLDDRDDFTTVAFQDLVSHENCTCTGLWNRLGSSRPAEKPITGLLRRTDNSIARYSFFRHQGNSRI